MGNARRVHSRRGGGVPHREHRHAATGGASRAASMVVYPLWHEGYSSGDCLVESAHPHRLCRLYRTPQTTQKKVAEKLPFVIYEVSPLFCLRATSAARSLLSLLSLWALALCGALSLLRAVGSLRALCTLGRIALSLWAVSLLRTLCALLRGALCLWTLRFSGAVNALGLRLATRLATSTCLLWLSRASYHCHCCDGDYRQCHNFLHSSTDFWLNITLSNYKYSKRVL